MKANYFTFIFIIISFCAEGQDITADIIPSYDSDGAIDLHVNAGYGPYDFQWTQPPSPTIIATTEDLSSLEPGTYCVTVTDALCGIAEVRFEVKDCEITIRIEDITRPSYVVQEECNADSIIYPLSNGSITISVDPPNPNYSISWSNNTSSFHINDLSHGTYTVTVANGLCSESKSIELSACEYLIPLGADSICTTDPDVNNNGTIEVILDAKENVTMANPCMGLLEISTISVGSILSFVSHWTGPNGFYSTDQDIYNLCEGNYCYFIDTGCGDEVDTCFSIVNCETNSIVVLGETTLACPLDDVGTISLTISGGVSPFTLIWDNGLSGNFIDGLAIGEYCVTVTDFNNCQKTECFTVDEGAYSICENDDFDGDSISDIYDECPEYYDPTNCCDIDGDGLCLDVDPCPEDSSNTCNIDSICDQTAYISIDGCILNLNDVIQCDSLFITWYKNGSIKKQGLSTTVFDPFDGTFWAMIECAGCPPYITDSVDINYGAPNFVGYYDLDENNILCFLSTADGFTIRSIDWETSAPGEIISTDPPHDTMYSDCIATNGLGTYIFAITYNELSENCVYRAAAVFDGEALYQQGTNDVANKLATYTAALTLDEGVLSQHGIDDLPNKLALKGISIYPNPTSGEFLIEYPSIERKQIQIDIYNILGECVVSINDIANKGENQFIIDMNHYVNGIYYGVLKTSTGGEVFRIRIVD